MCRISFGYESAPVPFTIKRLDLRMKYLPKGSRGGSVPGGIHIHGKTLETFYIAVIPAGHSPTVLGTG